MCRLKAIILGFAYIIHNAVAITAQQIAEDLLASLSTGSSVFLLSSSQFSEQITPRWDVYEPPTYQLAVKPALTEDIQAIVSIHMVSRTPAYSPGITLGAIRFCE